MTRQQERRPEPADERGRQAVGEILTDKAATSRFDGSDLMPGAVGAGTFWKGMTNWITGQDDKATLDYIENSWPKS